MPIVDQILIPLQTTKLQDHPMHLSNNAVEEEAVVDGEEEDEVTEVLDVEEEIKLKINTIKEQDRTSFPRVLSQLQILRRCFTRRSIRLTNQPTHEQLSTLVLHVQLSDATL